MLALCAKQPKACCVAAVGKGLRLASSRLLVAQAAFVGGPALRSRHALQGAVPLGALSQQQRLLRPAARRLAVAPQAAAAGALAS